MPVYFNTKNLFAIPRDDESDISENELYLEDPDMLFDRLPQPFRFINKIVNKICNDSWSRIAEIHEVKEQDLKRKYIESVDSINYLPDEDNIQSMCCIGESQVLMGLKDGLSLWNFEDDIPVVLDQWKVDGMNISSMVAYRFVEHVYLVAMLTEDGCASLISIVHRRMYFLRDFPGSRDGDKPSQVTNIVLDRNCGTMALSYSHIAADDHWLELSKINKEAWIKEIGAVQRWYQDYLSSLVAGSSGQSAALDTIANDVSAILDRNAIKVTPTNIIFKMKFPDSGSVPGIGNIHQLYKQVDITGNSIGHGLNHCITKNVIDARLKASVTDVSMTSVIESHLMRIASVRFLKMSGSLIPNTSNEEISDKEYSMMAVWWSQSPHLLLYGLNKPVPKDPWLKPDDVRSFSSPISACELSTDNMTLVVGLQNGLVILIDICSGQTKVIKKISDYSIRAITSLHYKDGDCLQYLNIIDDKHAMHCLKYNTSLVTSDSEVVAIESDLDVDSVVILGRSYDLALSVYQGGSLIIRDMFSGTAILKLELPDSITISSPWQPIFAFVSNSFLCIQALRNTSREDDGFEPTTLLYKLDLSQFQYKDLYSSNVKEESDSKSYITTTADDYLTRRYCTHSHRQDRLRECFPNLSQYLRTSSLTVT